MFNTEEFQELAQKLIALLPPSLQTIEQDIHQQIKDLLQASFTRMNVLTREEFDVQVKVLARTREKVDALQQQLDELLKNNPAP
jgi:BMFP domain-containing protein YqiC